MLLDEKGNAYADDEGHLRAPFGHEISEGPGGIGAAVFLGLDPQGNAWFALEGALTAFTAPRRVDLRSAAALWPAFDASVFAQARALQHWRSRHRFCGVCGGEVSLSRAGWQGTCNQCGTEHYPRTDPAVIVAITDGPRLLLGRQAAWQARRYSVIAGFVEPGESLEQTVAREAMEETGVRVRRCQLPGFAAVAVPGFADDRLHRATPSRTSRRSATSWKTHAGSPPTTCATHAPAANGAARSTTAKARCCRRAFRSRAG